MELLVNHVEPFRVLDYYSFLSLFPCASGMFDFQIHTTVLHPLPHVTLRYLHILFDILLCVWSCSVNASSYTLHGSTIYTCCVFALTFLIVDVTLDLTESHLS